MCVCVCVCVFIYLLYFVYLVIVYLFIYFLIFGRFVFRRISRYNLLNMVKNESFTRYNNFEARMIFKPYSLAYVFAVSYEDNKVG